MELPYPLYSAWFLCANNPKLSLIVLVLFLFAVYYLTKVAKRPDIYCKNGKLRSFLLTHCTQLKKNFYPTFWGFQPFFHTLLANAIRGTVPDIKFNREIVTLPDGGQLALDWYQNSQEASKKDDEDSRPIALFFPGITGDSSAEYIKTMVPATHRLGYRVVVLNNRGCGGVKLITRKLYWATNTEDLRYVLERLRSNYAKSQIVATGLSFGGIIICRYLIESGDRSLIDAAMLISMTFDFIEGAKSLNKPVLNRLLNNHIAKRLCEIFDENKNLLCTIPNIEYEKVMKSKTIWEFDENFTAIATGYSSVLDYYKDASNKEKLDRIRRPTLCLNAADDMFSPEYSLPKKEASESSHVCLALTHSGGHIGFMDGTWPRLPFFSERLHEEYLRSLITLNNIKQDLT